MTDTSCMNKLPEPSWPDGNFRCIGVKIVDSRPMTRGEYNEYRGWYFPEDEDASDNGFLVEYLDGGKPNDDRHEGYISWCPYEQFVNANRPCLSMTFGLAIEAMRKGCKVARMGWNGKGIHIALQAPDEQSEMTQEYIYIDTTGLQTDNSAAPKCLVPWLASQTDMLADDWCVIE